MQELSSVYYYWKGKAKKYSTTNTYDHPFQIIGVDIMELLLTAQENKYLIVFKTFFTKWPMAFPAPP